MSSLPSQLTVKSVGQKGGMRNPGTVISFPRCDRIFFLEVGVIRRYNDLQINRRFSE